MEKKALTAVSFLKSKEMREKYECAICTEVCVKPVRCRGDCKRIYCMKCVSDWRQNRDVCPLKCSKPFLVEPIPDIALEFFCPFSPTDCQIPIRSLKDFDSHYNTCPFTPPEYVHRRLLKQEYKCLKGHQLQFFIGPYEEMLQSYCQQCEEQHLCRSICRICNELYCVACRVPPCSKEGCPIGHQFIFQKIANLDYICDMCGVSTSVSNDGVYDDSCCNFGICEGCHATLPEHFDASKPRGLIANINTRCCCGQSLSEINSLHAIHECSLCRREKECPKQCKACRKFFCLKCKTMDIETDGCCGQHDHQLVVLNVTKFPLAVQIQNEYGCMICQTKTDEYYFDKKCKVRLCSACFSYCQRATGDKTRSIIVKCSMKHVLTYIAGSDDIIDRCSECKQQKIIKLRCYYCEEEVEGVTRKLNYCFECKPIKLDTCYYKHRLKHAKFQGQRDCHFCSRMFNEFHYCKKCFFYVCVECMEVNQNKFSPMEIEQESISMEVEEKAEVKMKMKEGGAKTGMEEELMAIKIQ